MDWNRPSDDCRDCLPQKTNLLWKLGHSLIRLLVTDEGKKHKKRKNTE